MLEFLSLSTDADKQAAINVFLGVFRPEVGQPNIWELQTDYYMHHSSTRLSVPTKTLQRYIILHVQCAICQKLYILCQEMALVSLSNFVKAIYVNRAADFFV